jgi:hypothetical protein
MTGAVALAVMTAVTGAIMTPATSAGAGGAACTGNPDQVLYTQPVLGLAGLYALPASRPIGLAVFGHGYRNTSASWVAHLTDAAHHGLIAVAVDYRGLGPAPGYYGWPARAGAEDLVTSGQYFQSQCHINKVVLLGVSMGGDMSGLAVAARAKRADHRPLWDYWIDTEGVTNWIETYSEALAAGKIGNAYADGARQDIENEAGGTPAAAPQAYADRDVLLRIPDIAASGVKGVIVIHSVEDGLVPYDQSRETATALRGAQVPTDVYSVLRRTSDRDPGHNQTTWLSDAGFGDQDPFSGHAWEGSKTHIVMTTSLARLYALFSPCSSRPSNREFAVDAQLGVIPNPDATSSCHQDSDLATPTSLLYA